MGGGAALWHNEAENTQKIYVDRQFFASYEDQVTALHGSTTVYIGNLSFYTTEAQIYALCARAGPVKKVIMGLNRHTKTPCGFCFVEHYTAEAALERPAREAQERLEVGARAPGCCRRHCRRNDLEFGCFAVNE